MSTPLNPTVYVLEQLAAAGRACPSCDADYTIYPDPDHSTVATLRIAHDRGCPVLASRARNRAERRAAARRTRRGNR